MRRRIRAVTARVRYAGGMLSPDDSVHALCRRVLTEYPHVLLVDRPDTIRIAQQRGGFSGAEVFRVDLPTTTWCLRRWPAGSLPIARQRELHRWLRFLREEGLPVAVPVPSRTGATLTPLDGTGWQLEPWLPGRSDFHTDPSDARLRQAMHTLARLHLASHRYRAEAAGAEWFAVDRGPSPAVQERLTRLKSLTPPLLASWREALRQHPGELSTLLRETMDLAASRLSQVAARLLPYRDADFLRCPCWRDLWHDHVLFQDTMLTGLVDASAARNDTPAVDLARLLGSFLGHPSSGWPAAFAMYSEVRSLAPEEEQLAIDLDFSGIVLSPFTWVRRFLDSPAMVNTADVTSRVAGLRDRLESIE